MNQLAQDIQDAAREIRELRHANALLSAKVQGFEMAARLVDSQAPREPGYGASPDIAWALDKHATTILAQDVPKQTPAAES
jgi:hypothetical protein